VDRARLANWRSQAARIAARAVKLTDLTNAQLRKQSLGLRYEVLSGRPVRELLVEAAALVLASAERNLGLQFYPVQVIGGLAMYDRSIAIMQTGEGKTLAATLPLYLAALAGKGAHLATANDYLASRDADLMRPLFTGLGLSVGTVRSDSDRQERKQAYQSDVTYTTAKEIGFDFLRDRLFLRQLQHRQGQLLDSLLGSGNRSDDQPPVQRDPFFVVVDEADSILIDEARTPLIVSGGSGGDQQARQELYRWAALQADQFAAEEHYQTDKTEPHSNQIQLTPAGRKRVRQLPKTELLRLTPILDLYQQIELAIHVNQQFFRDRHYVVKNNEIVIVDEFTGRLAEGRKWKNGLHQAIEAREGLPVSFETGEAARITIQDLFLRYPKIAGMTGTAANSGPELRKIYRVRVVEIPTNRPPRRTELPPGIFATESEKWEAIATEIEELHRCGRPVLIGTRSIDKSEQLSRLLQQKSIEHQILNARQLSKEAEIVAAAGQVSRVTVATNMAGRGTDIKISNAAADLGGLHVICSEMHESARIDRQLVGRCGRQGDPGSFRLFLSLEDDLLRQGFGRVKAKKIQQKYANLDSRFLCRMIGLFQTGQRKIERRHFQARKLMLYQEQQRHQLQTEMGQDPFLDTAGA
jgi:preprotein translocase subunit SecA